MPGYGSQQCLLLTSLPAFSQLTHGRNYLASESQSYFTTGGLLPINSSWRQTPWGSRPKLFFLFQLNPCGHRKHFDACCLLATPQQRLFNDVIACLLCRNPATDNLFWLSCHNINVMKELLCVRLTKSINWFNCKLNSERKSIYNQIYRRIIFL
jgi:hypothetical protein